MALFPPVGSNSNHQPPIVPPSAPPGLLKYVQVPLSLTTLQGLHLTPLVVVPPAPGYVHKPIYAVVQSSRTVAGGIGSALRTLWVGVGTGNPAIGSLVLNNNSAPFTSFRSSNITTDVFDPAGAGTSPANAGKGLQIDLDASIGAAQLTVVYTLFYMTMKSGF